MLKINNLSIHSCKQEKEQLNQKKEEGKIIKMWADISEGETYIVLNIAQTSSYEDYNINKPTGFW